MEELIYAESRERELGFDEIFAEVSTTMYSFETIAFNPAVEKWLYQNFKIFLPHDNFIYL